MTINPLTMRIKAAKSELLALKTSHLKAASLLKVFSATSSVPILGSEATIATITVRFSTDYGAYPYFRLEIEPTSYIALNVGSNIYVGTETYVDNGYSIEVVIIHLGYDDFSNNFRVTSTSPIVDISYEVE